ncbi:40S ribosomal protein S2-3, partial [Cucurbita argyrosperma subsp. sororia]
MAERGGFGRGFGGRGRGGGDRGRGGRRRAGRRDEEEKWVPVTKLGRLVKEGKIQSLEQIYLHSLPIKEHQIIDTLIGPSLKDEVMKIMPVQKQTRAGQRTRFKAFVVVGDGNGHVGLGVKCSKEVATAIRGSIILAKLSVIPVRRGYWGNKIGKPHTVPCKVTGKCGSVTVRMVPAPRGAGIVAARVPKKVLQFAGIEDVFTSSRGSTKTLGNFVKATFDCLLKTYGFLTPEFWRETRFTKSPFQEHTDLLAKPTVKALLLEDPDKACYVQRRPFPVHAFCRPLMIGVTKNDHGALCVSFDGEEGAERCNWECNELMESEMVGFGYDSKSRNFKVVRVVDFVELPCYFHPSRVEVYDLSKDKWREIQTPDRWREIQTPVCGKVFGTPCFEMYHEGTYYWWANAKIEGRTETIQSFDMSEEVFRPIPMPKSLKGKHKACRSMGVLNGSIVLFHYPWSGNGRREFDVWGMENDESGGVSWSKLLTIGPLYGIEKPLVFVGSHELLMEANEGQVILYNTRTQQFRKVPIKGHER